MKKQKSLKKILLAGSLLLAASVCVVLAVSDYEFTSQGIAKTYKAKNTMSYTHQDTSKLKSDFEATQPVLSQTNDLAEIKTKEVESSEPLSLEDLYPEEIQPSVSLYVHLKEMGISSPEIINMVNLAQPVKNLAFLKPGTRFKVATDALGKLKEIKFYFSPIEKLVVSKASGAWSAETILEDVDIRQVSFAGRVEFTLWDSALAANMDPYLIIQLANIFGWEVDFGREVQVGDRWRITAEQKVVGNQPVGWGEVVAAEYENSGNSHKAVLFRLDGENIGYYTPKGENLRKMFLKSPLRFGRITSRFNRHRFHPKLKRYRAHNGVDYGVPVGTPVKSVADGRVTFVGRRGGGGKIVKVRHNNKYKTAYKHLSRYGRGIKPGTKVRQGETIAYSGNTGLSTGPHLHYEFLVNGRFEDPLKQTFPPAEPVAKDLLPKFQAQAVKRIASLPMWESEKSIRRTWAHELIAPNAQASNSEIAIKRKPSSKVDKTKD